MNDKETIEQLQSVIITLKSRLFDHSETLTKCEMFTAELASLVDYKGNDLQELLNKIHEELLPKG